jgi:hypothetical protein
MAYPTLALPASGTTFAQFQKGGAALLIENIIAAIQAITPTTAPTAAATFTATGGGTTGGLLAAGTYFLYFAEDNGIGETLVGPQSAQLTVAAGNIPQGTFPALQTNNTSRSLYIGALNGLTGGPATLYADSITTTTFSLAKAAPAAGAGGSLAAVSPVTNNNTTLSTSKLSAIRAVKDGNFQQAFNQFSNLLKRFNSGDPIGYQELMNKSRDSQIVTAVIAQVFSESIALINANPGSIGSVPSILNAPSMVRTWP